MATTSIEWTEQTWNPVAGCTWASPGCDHCYAAAMTRRLEAMGQANYAGLTTKKHFNGVVRTLPDKLDVPLRRKKPTTWFVNSMSDLFHKDVPDSFIAAVFGVMAACPQHTFQVLTKRPDRMQQWCSLMSVAGGIGKYIRSELGRSVIRGHFNAVAQTKVIDGERQRAIADPWMQVMNGAACNYGDAPLHNVWLGTSVENQEQADKRIPHLLQSRAAVRFLSCEPLLGPLNLHEYLLGLTSGYPAGCVCGHGHGFTRCPNTGGIAKLCHHVGCQCTGFRKAAGSGIGWAIIGGESGHGARPCDVAWIRSIIAQCKAAGVPCFTKQLGEAPYDSDAWEEGNQFTSYEQWVGKASSWLGGVSGGGYRYKKAEKVVCVDSAGRHCKRGEGFMRARDEGTFPVKWHGLLELRDKKAGDESEWPDDLRVRELPEVNRG